MSIDAKNNKLFILHGIYDDGYKWALSLIDLPEFVTSVGSNKTKDNEAILYPNPTSNEITINFNEPITEQTSLEISDETGRMIYTNTLEIGISEFNWNTKDLSNGMYLCVVRNKNSSRTYKIMVVR